MSLKPVAGKTVKIGVVGAGRISQFAHLSSFRGIPDCGIVALADMRPQLATQVAQRFGIPKVYSTHTDLLADPGIDAVLVVTRRDATAPVVLDALRASRHVLSEKPMAYTAEQAECLVAAARDAGVSYAVGFMKRHDSGVRRAKDLVDRFAASGEMGAVVMVRAYGFEGNDGCPVDGYFLTDEPRPTTSLTWPTAPSWLGTEWTPSYDQFLNVHSHLVDLLVYFFAASPRITGVDFSHANGKWIGLDFGAHPGVFEFGCKQTGAWREGMEIVYERGRVMLELAPPLKRMTAATVTLEQDGDRRVWSGEGSPWAFNSQAADFVESIGGTRAPRVSGADALRGMHLIEKIWRHVVVQ